ncbi:MAG: hypothetical protein ABFD83_13730 [Armatimonadota bacterium]
MKYLKYIIVCIISILSIPAMADGGPEELGHHWQSHAYIGEIHFQLIVMAALTLAIIATSIVMRKRRACR